MLLAEAVAVLLNHQIDFGAGRLNDLLVSPAPIRLCGDSVPGTVEGDAIKDCSRRPDLILDPFAGSGTTITPCVASFQER
jgi:hypothetical protein